MITVQEIRSRIEENPPDKWESHANVEVWNIKEENIKITKRTPILPLPPFWYIRNTEKGEVYAGEALETAYEKYAEEKYDS